MIGASDGPPRFAIPMARRDLRPHGARLPTPMAHRVRDSHLKRARMEPPRMPHLPLARDDDKEAEEPGESDRGGFDQIPVRVVCPHCSKPVTTLIEHESSWLTVAVSIALFMTLGWAALIVVPVIFPLFKDVVHHCPKCLSVLATRSRVELPSWRQDIMSFRFGNCVVVLARKYVVLLIAIAIIVGGIHWVQTSGAPSSVIALAHREPPLDLTWINFTKDCGYQSYLDNPIRVNMAFDRKYRNHTFKWTGTMQRVEDGFEFLGFVMRGTIFVRMEPQQFPSKPHAPDLVLTFSDRHEVARRASKLKYGQAFDFEATMLGVGKRGAPHAMVLWDLDISGEAPPDEAEITQP